MNLYTCMFIVQPNLTEQDYENSIGVIKKVFEDFNSNVLEVKKWGMRDLAYEIDDLRQGFYVLLKVEATPEAVAEYNRVCNIREDIIRHILVKD